ncbi:MAG TPA: YdbL family protein [Sphingomicrobium sp.]|nr:YdbL family protein [Sphingomicrobium sp.]
MKRIPVLVAACGLAAAPAAAQSPALSQAIQAGQVGERYDGYMAAAGNVSAEVQRQVSAINIRRRNLYIGLASRRNVTPEVVGLATACQLFSELAAGEAYMLNDRVWRRHAAGQPVPLPDYCR